MQHLLHINGTANAFPREFGCGCARCLRSDRAVNTSASLISLNDAGNPVHHVLFDVGNGVTESVVRNPLFAGHAPLDLIALTHWHSDHAGELELFVSGVKRANERHGRAHVPPGVWTRQGGAAHLDRERAFVWQTLVTQLSSGETLPAGHVLPDLPITQPGLRITPITQYHGSADWDAADRSKQLSCCAGFVIRSATCKGVVMWDLDATNDWILADGPAAQLVRDADWIVVDTNTWRAEINHLNGRPTNHASFFTVLRYMQAMTPKRTVLTHLSNHEDLPGDGFGWSDDVLERNARREWAAAGAPGTVEVARVGATLAL